MGDEIAKKAFVLPVRLIVKFFLTADIITLLIQMSGGGLMASGGDMASLGNKAMLVGLIVQVLTFSFFTLVLLIFGWRVHRRYSHLVHPNTPFKINRFNPFSIEPVSDWRVLFWILVITCVGIEVRCVFRILEGIGGHDSYLAVHEVFFYLFDCVPLWISMTLFAYVWPLRVIDGVAMEGSTTRFDSRHEVFRRISTHEDANVSFTSEGPYDSKYGGRPQSGDVPLYPYRA
ncbi:hypothetical protein Rhopal_000400-T1 [Rhodotorula paludigena]|uniref:Uncharacterized protein n=1 Tax=Rhodotorula paludigena TaxID=86838 RepID=A0AAV5G4Q4_9BASI|nr:hypothetical protein Rhopal_000400-T1 [Rhodotorula paludigena]